MWIAADLLTLDNDLLESVDELVSSLLGELVVEELLSLILLLSDLSSGVLIGGELVFEGSELGLQVLLITLGSLRERMDVMSARETSSWDWVVKTHVGVGLVGGLVLGVEGLALETLGASVVVCLLALFGSLLQSASGLGLSVLLGLSSLVGLLLGVAGGGGVAVSVDVPQTLRGGGLGVVLERLTSNLGLEDGSLAGADGLAVLGDPLVGRGLLVDLVELLLAGSGLLSRVGGNGGEKVSTDESEVGDDLSHLGVGEDEGEERSEVDGSVLGIVLEGAGRRGQSVLGLGSSRNVGLPED